MPNQQVEGCLGAGRPIMLLPNRPLAVVFLEAAGGAQKTGAAAGGGLFGSATTTKPASGGGLFGSTQNTASTGGGGLFGAVLKNRMHLWAEVYSVVVLKNQHWWRIPVKLELVPYDK